MPRQKTIDVYSYDELTGRAKENAAQTLREWSTDYAWWEYSYDLWKSALEQLGFDGPDIRFSGFWSQGDGASFTANVDIEKMVRTFTTLWEPSEAILDENNKIPWVAHKVSGIEHNPAYSRLANLQDYVNMDVVRSYGCHYVHEKSCSVQYEMYTGNRKADRVEKLLSQLQESVEQLRYDLCNAIYRWLEDEFDGLTSDEAIADFAKANKYEWDEQGNPAYT